MYFNIICGKTGSGKSRLLEALETQGAQVLDLEKLAAHRGSLLGDLPDAAQPPQKLFESLVWERLSRLDPGQPVYVEAESKKIGSLRVPDALIQKMWQSKCYVVEAAITQRVQFLKREYSHFLEDTQELQSKLELISRLHSHEVLNHWDRLAQNKQWDQLVQELLEKHYDPAYQRSILKHYGHHAERTLLRPENLEASGLNQLAADLSSSRN
jgi:tRNA 2-selenouridine synthase